MYIKALGFIFVKKNGGRIIEDVPPYKKSEGVYPHRPNDSQLCKFRWFTLIAPFHTRHGIMWYDKNAMKMLFSIYGDFFSYLSQYFFCSFSHMILQRATIGHEKNITKIALPLYVVSHRDWCDRVYVVTLFHHFVASHRALEQHMFKWHANKLSNYTSVKSYCYFHLVKPKS